MKPPPVQPEQRNTLLVCLGLSFAIFLVCVIWPQTHSHDLSDGDITGLWLGTAGPLIGAIAGFGFGALSNRRMRGMLIGLGLALAIDFAALMLISIAGSL